MISQTPPKIIKSHVVAETLNFASSFHFFNVDFFSFNLSIYQVFFNSDTRTHKSTNLKTA